MLGKGSTLVLSASVLAAVSAGLVMAVLAGRAADDPSPIVASGLEYPRGLSAMEDGSLLVAEVMGGRLLRLTLEGHTEPVAQGLPVAYGGPAMRYPTGASAAVQVEGIYYYVVGEYRGRPASSLYAWGPAGEPRLIAGGLGRDGFPATPITNPYALLPHPDGGFVISDGGRNALLRVTEAGDVSEMVRFQRRPHPDPEIRSQIDVVPTGITFGPDGALYMASFTGQPYTPGIAVVYRLEHVADGEALEVEVYAEGFSFATDVAFAPDGSLLVTEFTTDMRELIREHGLDAAEAVPGRLVRWREGAIEVIADDLVTPTALAVMGDRAFVSEEFAGRITEVRLDQPEP